MTINKVNSDTVADSALIEHTRQTQSGVETKQPDHSIATPGLDSKLSVTRDPGELILQTDAWQDIPTSQRTFSGGPPVPDSVGADLAAAVNHAVSFVIDRAN